MSELELSEEQERVVELVRQGYNVYFSGDAGTGKSMVLRHIIDMLRACYDREFSSSVAVTAATGIAAVPLRGSTLHTALGCGAPRADTDFLGMWAPENRARLKSMKVLIIDEISMVSAELFEFLDTLLRQIRRRTDTPFGGIQLVLSGDFFQLPPVSRSVKDGSIVPGAFLNRGYAFQAPAWRKADLWSVKLTKVFRQADPMFVCLLNSVRYGDTRAAEWLFKLTSAPFERATAVRPTRLFARNADVDRVNAEELAKLEGSCVKLQAVDRVTHVEDPVSRRRLFAMCNEGMAQRTLVLKEGAQVMLVKNYMGLVNGSCGVVETFAPLSDFLARDRAMPAAQHFNCICWGAATSLIPVVRFSSGRRVMCGPEAFEAELVGVGQSCRVQVPLKLAWALTIHKCQGMSLDLVDVSLEKCFADGQAYVALSRARSLEGLRVSDWAESCVKTSPAVVDFVNGVGADNDDAWEALQREHACQPPEPPALDDSSDATDMTEVGDTDDITKDDDEW